MAGNWPSSNYVSTDAVSGFGAKVVSNNFKQNGFGVTDAIMISGHRTVATLDDLYTIPRAILSSTYSNSATEALKSNVDGADAIGEQWYVQSEKAWYQLKDWSKFNSKDGWEKCIDITTSYMDNVFTNIENKSGDQSKAIEELKTAYTYFQNTYTYLQGKVTYYDNAYAYLQGKVKDYDTAYSYNKLAYSWTQDQITNNNANISNLNTAYSYFKETYTYIQGKVKDYDTAYSYFKETYTYIQDKVTYYDNAYGYLQDKVVEYDNAYKYFNDSYTYLVSYIAITYSKSQGSIDSSNGNLAYKLDGRELKISPRKDDNALSFGSEFDVVTNVTSYTYDGDGDGEVDKTSTFVYITTKTLPSLGTTEGTAFDGASGNAIKKWMDDIEARLTGTTNYKTVGTITTHVSWTRYKADGSTKYDTPTSDADLTVFMGDWIEAEYYVVWARTTSSATVNSTSGPWGNSAISTDASSTGGTLETKKISKVQLTGKGSSQTTNSAQKIEWYIGDSTSSLVVTNGVVRKQNGSKQYQTTTAKTYRVSATNDVCRWYGATSLNVSSATTDQIKGILSSLSSDSSWSKDLTKAGKTDATNKYYIYIWPQSAGKVTQASIPGADATGWFSISNLKEIEITADNGFAIKYYYIYALNENALSAGPTITFS